MRFYLILSLLIFISRPVEIFAQHAGHNEIKTVSFELGKNGLIYNVAFDYQWRNSHLGVRVVLGSNFAKYLKAVAAGVGGYYLIGKKSDLLELGLDLQYHSISEVSDDQIGFALVYPSYSIEGLATSINIGYRNRYKRNVMRIGFSPIMLKDVFIPGAYFSYGRSF